MDGLFITITIAPILNAPTGTKHISILGIGVPDTSSPNGTMIGFQSVLRVPLKVRASASFSARGSRRR
ncbi:MAG UNVERIFIED_CONTAM: hypothetical protein LVT10_18965 [Anaerolineae bacterium]